MRPPPEYPLSPYPLLAGGGLAPAAQENAVVSVAVRYLGVPYLWGGARPKTGFDCSGLVQYVFAQLGVNLPHYAAGQYYAPEAVWVSPNRLQPGDLVFFTGADGTRKAPGHVGIYVGDGYFIDAPHTHSFVRIDSLDAGWFANNYVGAKRIVGDSLRARYLLHATKHEPVRGAPRQLTSGAYGQSPQLVAAVQTSARASEPRAYGLWVGVGLCGFLLVFAGAVTYGRRRPAPAAKPGSDTTD